MLATAGAGSIVAGIAPPARHVGPETTASGPRQAATEPAAPGAIGRRGQLTTGPVMAPAPPARLDIPTLGVSTRLTGLGLRPDGTMQVPGDGDTAGWYTGAPTPGALGPAILAAHVDWNGKPGVFARLATLRPGDRASVRRADGSVAVFQVTEVARYPKARFPTRAVFGTIDHAGLRLITCSGAFDTTTRSYRDNVVVYARLVRAGTERAP